MRRLPLIIIALVSAVMCRNADPEPFPEVGEPYAITSGPKEHLLASYFGINSWSPDGRYVSVLEIGFSGRLAEQTDTATIALVDLQDGNKLIPVSKTTCWNFQEAAMAHWIDDDTRDCGPELEDGSGKDNPLSYKRCGQEW